MDLSPVIALIISAVSTLVAVASLVLSILSGYRNQKKAELLRFESTISHAEERIEDWMIEYGEFQAKLLPYWNRGSYPCRPSLDDYMALHTSVERLRQLCRLVEINLSSMLLGKLLRGSRVKDMYIRLEKSKNLVCHMMWNSVNAVFVQYLCLVPEEPPSDVNGFIELVHSETNGELDDVAKKVVVDHSDERGNIPYLAELFTSRVQEKTFDYIVDINKCLCEMRMQF